MRMKTNNESGTFTQKIKNAFSVINSVFSSKYFLIPAFGLDFALRGGTKSLIPLLASMGIATSYPLLVELGFALLAGVGIYYTYKAAMDYVISPVLNFCGQWLSHHVYQPCCNFAKNMFSNTLDVVSEAGSLAQIRDQAQFNDTNIELEASPAVFLPLNSLTAVEEQEQTKQKPISINPQNSSQKLR